MLSINYKQIQMKTSSNTLNTKSVSNHSDDPCGRGEMDKHSDKPFWVKSELH